MMTYWGLVFSVEMLNSRNGAGQVKLFHAFEGLHSMLETQVFIRRSALPTSVPNRTEDVFLDRWF